MSSYQKDRQYYQFCAYGFLKNLRFFDAFLLLFFLENGITYTQIGLLYATREIAINVLEIPSGIVADTFGRKYSLVLAFALYIFAFLVFYFSTSFLFLLLAVVLMGLGDAFRSGTHKGMIIDYLKSKGWSQHKISYYGGTRSWSQRGSAISALIAGILVLYSGDYRSIYLLSIIPYLLNFVNILSYPQALNFSQKSSAKSSKKALGNTFRSFVKTLKQKQVFAVINSAALHSAYLKSIKDYIQIVMLNIALAIPILTMVDDKQKSGLVIGILYFIIYLLNSQASRFAGKLSAFDQTKTASKTLMFGLSMGLLSGIMLYQEWWGLAWCLFALIYLVENLRKPVLTGMLADQVPNEILTSVLSAQSFYGTILVSGLALAFGLIADYSNIGLALGLISAALLVFSRFAERLLPSTKKAQ
ncbi:MAG: MFS transporter [Bacteroidia bacterium]